MLFEAVLSGYCGAYVASQLMAVCCTGAAALYSVQLAA